MTDRLRVTELDFDQIKANMKAYLKQQDQFQDYDFEGSGLNILMDLLAYNTHYNAYYLNMVANEAFMDTAQLRSSVVSHAKTLGYTPFSTTPPLAVLNITVKSGTTNPGSLTIPKGFKFVSNLVDGTAYEFVTMQPYTVTKVGENFYFEGVELYQGKLTSSSYAYDVSLNPKSIFVLNNPSIDTSSLSVTVRPSQSSLDSEVYNLVTDVLDVTGTSKVYFLSENKDGKYEIKFGDDVVGASLQDGSVVVVEYLVTDGSSANKASSFVSVEKFGGVYSNYTVTVTSAAAGGKSKQTVEDIKRGALSQFATQNRLVTFKDYEAYIIANYPNVDAVSVWGGETQDPPVYGKVYLSLKPKNNYYITESEKTWIIENIINPKSIVSTTCEIIDPDYLYLLLNCKVQYEKRRTTLTPPALKNVVTSALINFKNENLNTFAGSFIASQAQQEIKSSENSITGSEIIVRAQKRFKPQLGVSASYTLKYEIPLHRGSLSNKLSSTDFTLYDSSGVLRTCKLEEVPQSYSGITEILVTNPGYNYTDQPTVTITGDGTGATAVAVISNGKLEKITVINRGSEYTRAIVTITGGGGTGAAAVPVLDAKHGDLRTIYYDDEAKRQIINEKAGTINYETGVVEINNIRFITTDSTDGYIRVDVEADNYIVKTDKNTILTIDDTDAAAFSIEMIEA